MAIIRTSSIVAAISGSLGGQTFVNAKTGLVARTRTFHRPNHSATLLRQQSNFANMIRRWRSLSTEERQSWRSFASTYATTNRLGVAGNPSGFNAFVQINLIRLAWLGEPINTPFSFASRGHLNQVTTSFALGGPYNVSWTGVPGPTPLDARIDGTPHASTIVPKFSGPLRLVRVAKSINPIIDTINIQPQWDAIFGPLQTGQAYSIDVGLWNLDAGGLPNPALRAEGIVTP